MSSMRWRGGSSAILKPIPILCNAKVTGLSRFMWQVRWNDVMGVADSLDSGNQLSDIRLLIIEL